LNYEGVTRQRSERAPIARELAIADGIGFVRQKQRVIITPLAERMRILEENEGKPEEFRSRSLRRRLTRVDRVLTDLEAGIIDRAFNAWLTIEGNVRGVSWDSQGIRGGGDRSPLSGRQLYEVGQYQQARAKLSILLKERMDRLFALMSPWYDGEQPDINGTFAFDVKDIARILKNAYGQAS
jgi:hypothetical protein